MVAGSKVPSDPTMTAEVRRFLDGISRDLLTIPTLATQAEAEAGTDNTAYMSALRVAQAIAALTPPGLVLLQTQVGAGASTPVLDFVHGIGGVVLDDTYDRYRLVIDTLRPATDDVALFIRTGTGVGPTYAATSYSIQATVQDAGTAIIINSTTAVGMQFTRTAAAGNAVGNAAAESVSLVVEFSNPESTTQNCIFNALGGGYDDPDGLLICITGGSARHSTPAAITGVRVLFSTGDITSGRASLYAYSKG